MCWKWDMVEVLIELSKGGVIRRARLRGDVAVLGNYRGEGLIISIKDKVTRKVKVGTRVTTASIGKRYLFGGKDVIVLVNGETEFKGFKGIPLGSYSDYLVVLYQGGDKSKVVNLRDFYSFEVKGLGRSIAEAEGLVVLGERNGVKVFEKSREVQSIAIDEVVGVASLGRRVYVLSRDPFFVNVSWLHAFELSPNGTLEKLKRVELGGLAYDLDASNGKVVASTNQTTYAFDEELNVIRTFEGGVSATTNGREVCLVDRGTFKCYVLES